MTVQPDGTAYGTASKKTRLFRQKHGTSWSCSEVVPKAVPSNLVSGDNTLDPLWYNGTAFSVGRENWYLKKANHDRNHYENGIF